MNIFEHIFEVFPEKNVVWPLQRSKSGHYYIYGEQPNGRMNLPYEKYKQKYDLWYEGIRNAHCSALTLIGANAITL